jgi:hypothetical protein
MVLTEKEIIQFADAELKKPFAWGITDCNTIAARFLDLIKNAERRAHSAERAKLEAIANRQSPIANRQFFESQILHKYNDMRSAILFQKQFGRTAEDVLIEAGAVPCATGFEQTGDFILVDTERWQCCHIYLCGKVLSSGPEKGVAMYPIALLQKPYRVMRII